MSKPKFNIDRVRRKLDFDASSGEISLFNISRLLDHPDRYDLDFDVYLSAYQCNLQRPYVWNIDQQREFILSWLKGIHIPPISVVIMYDYSGTKKSTGYKIIDGKQRLTTMIRFVKNEFSIVVDGHEYYFNELDQKTQHTLSVSHYVRAYVAYDDDSKPIPDSVLVAWFNQINFAGTPQDKDHMNNLLKLSNV